MAQLVASNMLSYRCAGWKEHHFPVLQNLCLQPGETPAAAKDCASEALQVDALDVRTFVVTLKK